METIKVVLIEDGKTIRDNFEFLLNGDSEIEGYKLIKALRKLSENSYSTS
jgi:hypothetical protein